MFLMENIDTVGYGTRPALSESDLSKFELLKNGDFEQIYKAVLTYDTKLDSSMVKVLVSAGDEASDKDIVGAKNAINDLFKEVAMLQRLSHENIIQYLGFGERKIQVPVDPSILLVRPYFMVTKSIDGGNLGDILHTNLKPKQCIPWRCITTDHQPSFPYQTLLKAAQQLARALDYMHNKRLHDVQFIHRGNTAQLIFLLLLLSLLTRLDLSLSLSLSLRCETRQHRI